jgi:hypothetical protein
VEKLKSGAAAAVEYNTDTLTLEYVGHRLTSALTVGGRARGEFGAANLLIDHFREGEVLTERGILASYVHLDAWLKARLAKRTYLALNLGARHWFFGTTKFTSDSLTLPVDTLVLEPRLSFTWWGLQSDKGWRDRHRVYPRLKGLAIGFVAGANWQQATRAWGELEDPDRPEVRNQPDTWQVLVTQWLLAGATVVDGIRVQLQEEAGWAEGEDDLYRRTLGGMTPYSVNIPGVPWAYFHAGDYAAVQTSVRFSVEQSLELGPLVSVIALRDPDRSGASEFGVLWGVGAEADWRRGVWQLNLRGGFSPSIRTMHPGTPGWTALLALGWAEERTATK